MATSFHPSDIQYVSDSNIQLQSLTYIRNSSAGPYDNQAASYQDSDPHDLYQNGNHGNGGSGSSAAIFSPHQPSSVEYDIVEVEEEATTPVRTDPPKDFYRVAVFVMILFCSPIGLTAVQSSRQCRKAIALRNMDIADARSQEAKGRVFLAVLTGIASWLVIAAFIALGVLS